MKQSNKTQEALKMAKEVIKYNDLHHFDEDALKAIKAIDEALAQPAQEPVAVCKDSIVNWVNGKAIDGWLYVHPAPAREPVAWMHSKERLKIVASPNHQKNGYTIPLYTHPAPEQNEFARTKSCQECENLKHDLEGYMDANKELINREWQGLSDDEKKALHKEHRLYIPTIEKIDAMLKKKNT